MAAERDRYKFGTKLLPDGVAFEMAEPEMGGDICKY
jgi:hypothetical protein